MNNAEAASRLIRQSLRPTRIRTALLKILTSHPQPITTKAILGRLSARGLSPHKTTVYRDIDAFLSRNLVTPVELADGVKRIELFNDHHHHLVCLDCHSITDVIPDHDLRQEERRLAAIHHFKIQRHALEFYGLCRRCH